MARPSPRPRFALTSKLERSEIRRRINATIKSTERLRGFASDERIEISIGGPEHHFWSPQLIVRMTQVEDDRTSLEARFGPDPYVWALYLLTYATLLLLTFWAVLFGFAQWWLSMAPTALLAAPAFGLLAALVYGASYVGQGLGSDQMFFLRATIMRLCDCHDASLATEGDEMPNREPTDPESLEVREATSPRRGSDEPATEGLGDATDAKRAREAAAHTVAERSMTNPSA